MEPLAASGMELAARTYWRRWRIIAPMTLE